MAGDQLSIVQQQQQQSISLQHLRILFAALACSDSLFRRAILLLTDARFPPRYAPHRGWFNQLKAQWDEEQELPNLDLFKSILSAWLEEQLADDDDIREISEIFRLAQGLSKVDPEKIYKQANKYLTLFAESLVREDLELQLQYTTLDEAISAAKSTLIRVRASDEDRFANPLETAGKVGNVAGFYIPTGHELYDKYTGGKGPAAGNVVGHGAVSGGGKTTFVSQLATMLAASAREECDDDEPKQVYIFAWENITDPMTLCLSFGAGVLRDKVDDYIIAGDNKQFSRRKKYTKEECKKYAKRIQRAKAENNPKLYPAAEWERLQRARKQMLKNLMIVNFTRSAEINANYSNDYIDGVYRFIEDHQHKINGPGVKAVFIDYTGIAVRRHLEAVGKFSTDRERALIEDGPSQSTRIAADYSTFVHMSQQLSGEQSAMAEGSAPDGNAFKGCKTFPENCDSCMVSGVPVKSNGLTIWRNNKSRRGQRQEDQVMKLDGAYARWSLIEADYTIKGNQVVSTSELEMQSVKQQAQFDLETEVDSDYM